jgi:hypothetical protein
MEGWYSTKCRLTWKLKATKSHRFYFLLVPLTLPIEGTEFGLLHTMLPTPTANDIMSSQEERIIIKNNRFIKKNKVSGTEFGPKLVDIARLLPTPNSYDWNTARSEEALQKAKERHKQKGVVLQNSLRQIAGQGSQLSPQFVMEMMGFPTDWTLLPFLNGETNQLKQEETQ